MNLTDQFIDRICAISYEDITPHAIEMVKICLIDTIGVAIACLLYTSDAADE